ncbi:amino acid transporter [Streptomyces sp. NBC_01267]|uniref:amino acid transporter n=1 Tax=unclassified Streptomyces TaxID=2593676 RepID=UPI0020257107|nr:MULTISPECIES: amino acid transporter [unclassified Streptomyces]MCX4553560.1 amino acid transporter [Streptomyces sp. NBC_01500]WSC18511.1 amino acid transporter [Streptomyces sp. NBC_01766]WSV52552.1 amino acid transporter [Streptomyces sp. NBC_01014]
MTGTQAEPTPEKAAGSSRSWRAWLLEGLSEQTARHPGPHGTPPAEHKGHAWWRVMCLTGVDYFSTLGYQPGIAALAAGLLSPLATLVLLALTLGGALPVYRRVAHESPHGEGSIAMLERLLPWWAGKLFVLVLLGFAATDFMITITLSAADASAHVVENPFAPHWLHGANLWITLGLISGLGAIFLKGFKEAIGIAVVLVAIYLGLNLIVLADAVWNVANKPVDVSNWWQAARAAHSSPLAMIGVALLVFPKLALGMSGFETGVAVMPQIRGAASDTYANPAGRIRDTRRLLTTAALIMSGFLLVSSLATTILIPAPEFKAGGQANGRALAYLAHTYLGEAFGTVYDVSTIAILWFAGASALAGLLNLVPRYLPRYGMAPEWTRAVRPLVLIFVAIAFFITWQFDANVDKQSGAYATGVLVLMLSASFASTVAVLHRRRRRAALGFGAITAVFAYTLVTNVIERPDGLKIASLFIVGILLTSFASRVRRAFELRAAEVTLDAAAVRLVDLAARSGPLQLIANEPHEHSAAEYRAKENSQREATYIPGGRAVLFLEVTVQDSSDFTVDVAVHGEERYGVQILRVVGPGVPNTIAAVLLQLREHTGEVPHAYFNWTEGNPVGHLLRFLVFGDGEVAPVTREVLRRAEPDPALRPRVHVG